MKKKISILSILPWIVVGCASAPETTVHSDIAPAAQAEVDTKKVEGNNTKLSINVKHMADPARIDEGAAHYVVWVEPSGSDEPQNVGTLVVDDDLEGKYETTVPFESFTLLITAEQDRLATYPSGPVIFERPLSSG